MLAASTPSGLLEIELEVRDGAPVVASRRVIESPGAYAPLLIASDEGLLLFFARYASESLRRVQGGQHLLVSRRLRGSKSWSAPQTLTLDLNHGAGRQRAVCVRGARVTAAWADNRYAEAQSGWKGFDHTQKLCVATSDDHGATWSEPVLLHDPDDDQQVTGLALGVFDDGKRIVVMQGAAWSGEAPPGTFLVSYDLKTCCPERWLRWSDLEKRRGKVE